MEPELTVTSTAEYADTQQFLSGSLAHFILEDNRVGSEAPDMDTSGYLKAVVAGIQAIGSLVIIGEVGAAGMNRIRFAVENTGRPPADFAESIAHALNTVVREDDAVPPVKGVGVEAMTY